jgi:S1-C subfamily serine protease
MAKTLYEILGVTKDAGDDQLRGAFERLSQRQPPLDAVQRMAVKEAFATLIHPQRRAAYDASLHSTPAPRRGSVAAASAGEPSPLRRPLGLALAALALAATWWAVRPNKVPAPAAKSPVVWAAAPDAAPASTTATTATTAAAGRVLSAEELFARLSPSVVRVSAQGDNGESQSLGSGVVVDAGTVITNCHVVRRGSSLKVKHQAEQYGASVTTADEAHDLCKLSVPGLAAPAVTVGRVAGLRVGQKVYAIGSPQGLDLTLSDGMVSSLREGPDGTFVQTTAPVSPGSSGGGLFDEMGTLVGIVTFQMRGGQNLNFAVPADWIAQIAPSSGAPVIATAPAPERETAAPPPPTATATAARGDATTALIVGRWNCFGPLTGRGLELLFEANGMVSGSSDGKPLRGRYFVQNRQLQLVADLFQIEEIDVARMVLSKGQGRRLACTH